MNAATSLPAPAAIDPLLRPRTVVDLDAARRQANQKAASEGRVEPVASYTTNLPERASFIQVAGGALGFIAFWLASPLTLNTYLARTHHPILQFQGAFIAFLLLGNLGLAYLMALGHEGLHWLACKMLGGQPALTKVGEYGAAWSAPAQGFSRPAYQVVTVAPFVIATVIFAILLAALPQLAAFLIAALVVNSYLSARDLWMARMAAQQPTSAALFVDTHGGFVAYAITASKPAKKPTTPIKPTSKGKPGK